MIQSVRKTIFKFSHFLIFTFFLIFTGTPIFAQTDIDSKIKTSEQKITELRIEINQLKADLETYKIEKLENDLQKNGIPKLEKGDIITVHTAMSLCYVEKYEQPKWVAHIILPDISEGVISRTNDFRPDPAIATGSAVKEDYWNSGYDRGHLAPSADFRWSEKALSESYFYSNMSPQKPDFNRGIWAILESTIREFVETKKVPVYVVTGGILKDGLPKIGRDSVSVPKLFYKVVLDLSSDTLAGIGFVIPNEGSNYPVMNYAVSIDSVERLTGIKFFPNLPDSLSKKLKTNFDPDFWQTGKSHGNIKPLNKKQLPAGAFNTVQAKSHIDETATVCGTVVSVKYVEKSGNTFINLDQKFPNQIFWCTIWKSNRVNFSYDPQMYLINKKICVTGEIKLKYGEPSMSIRSEKNLIILDDEPKK
jgi:endonuclease G